MSQSDTNGPHESGSDALSPGYIEAQRIVDAAKAPEPFPGHYIACGLTEWPDTERKADPDAHLFVAQL